MHGGEMDVNDTGLLEWSFKGLVSIVLTVGAWLWVMLVKSVNRTKDDLSDHKLHVSENYAKKTEISDVFDCIAEIRNDIKTLLQRHK